jgi:tripartite-type tricarboxylate transporter receptor subunit TctC
MTLAKAVTRRAFLAAASLELLVDVSLLLPLVAAAQTDWPNRPIRLIVPFAAGGSSDVVARAVATKLTVRLGQPVVIENMGGAGGNIGVNFVAKSRPDGCTLLCGSTTIATAAATGYKLPYDPAKDLEPIGPIGTTPLLIAVSSTSKIQTLQQLIDEARAKPKGVNYGSGGVGSMSHLGMELFCQAAKVQMLHVPYRGVSLALNDVIAGNVQVTMTALGSVQPLIDGGRLRPLAVTSPQRTAFRPNLPTVAEAGVPGFEIEFWWGLIGPANMPVAVVKRINDELKAVMALPEVRELLSRDATTPRPGSPEDLGHRMNFDLTRWKSLVKNANIKID